MIKKFYLQLFADEPGAVNEPTPAGTEPAKPGAGNEPAPAATVKPQGELKYTDEDVNKLIDKKFAEWQKKQEKAVGEAKKLAEMNATQKAEYERDQLQKELAELKKANALSEMSKTARKMLSENGITITDELLSLMISTDAEETKAAVDSFSKLFSEAVESAVKERLKGEPPRVGTGGGAAKMTKEEIMAIKDPELRQKKMLENKHLFNF